VLSLVFIGHHQKFINSRGLRCGGNSTHGDFAVIGRTIPSFRIALDFEERKWKPFRNVLNKKSDRKESDEMFDIPRLYESACSNSVQLVPPPHPIIMSILFHHYKELNECIKQVEQIKDERKKGLLLLLLTRRHGSSISTPILSSGSFDSGLHRIRKRYKHLADVPTSEM
jgi:hypothetical protein